MRKVKIIATIGPASREPATLREMLQAGVDVCRLNFSHGTHEEYRSLIAEIRRAAAELENPVAILQDLQSVKIRTGPLVDGEPVTLEKGNRITITADSVPGTAERVSTNFLELPEEAVVGDRILLSDGALELVVELIEGRDVVCRIVIGGRLAENQGINLPGAEIDAPALTPKDRNDILFGLEQGVDYLALSFVRSAADVRELKEFLSEQGVTDLPVIAKLEKPSSIQNLDEILQEAEGVMVARGDLGVEMSPEKVPIIQKKIIAEANQQGKLVITATQMLESMNYFRQPTRAEASDVANAVLDGTDAVMLSGETAAGRFPVESVEMMARIVVEAETVESLAPYRTHRPEGTSFPEAVCRSAYHASKTLPTRAIVAFTQSGSTAFTISKYRPRAEILGVTPHQRVLRRMCLFWGVHPLMMRPIANVDELILELEECLTRKSQVQVGDNLIILTGAPIIEKGHTSLMKLHQVRARE